MDLAAVLLNAVELQFAFNSSANALLHSTEPSAVPAKQ